MKIGNPADKPAPAPAAHGAPVAHGHHAASATAIPAKADDSATIELSNAASTLISGSSTPEFDAAKVDRISKAIQAGTFKIDPEAIADKLIANAKEALAKVQS
ncbi:MAG: flagellar biosynthesis anti-sigma factor FlgM [Burkholderiales bacterium]